MSGIPGLETPSPSGHLPGALILFRPQLAAALPGPRAPLAHSRERFLTSSLIFLLGLLPHLTEAHPSK